MAGASEFATLSSAALQEAATAAIDSVEGVAGSAAGAASGGPFEFFETLAERNREAIAAFRLSALEDEVINLRNELRALVRRLAAEGKKPDRQDPMSQTVAASEFMRNILSARTVEKRTALVHATVAQFDPRKGTPATRDYWLQRVREVPEGELALVLLLVETGVVTFLDDGRAFDADSRELHLPSAERIAFRSMAQSIVAALDPARLVTSWGDHEVFDAGRRLGTGPGYELSEAGSVFVSFCNDDGPR